MQKLLVVVAYNCSSALFHTQDLPGAVRQIAQFLGIYASEETLSNIAYQCTFDRMKKNPGNTYTWFKKGQFFRKGTSGNWQKWFTPEQNSAFDEDVVAKLKGSGLEFDFGNKLEGVGLEIDFTSKFEGA